MNTDFEKLKGLSFEEKEIGNYPLSMILEYQRLALEEDNSKLLGLFLLHAEILQKKSFIKLSSQPVYRSIVLDSTRCFQEMMTNPKFSFLRKNDTDMFEAKRALIQKGDAAGLALFLKFTNSFFQPKMCVDDLIDATKSGSKEMFDRIFEIFPMKTKSRLYEFDVINVFQEAVRHDEKFATHVLKTLSPHMKKMSCLPRLVRICSTKGFKTTFHEAVGLLSIKDFKRCFLDLPDIFDPLFFSMPQKYQDYAVSLPVHPDAPNHKIYKSRFLLQESVKDDVVEPPKAKPKM